MIRPEIININENLTSLIYHHLKVCADEQEAIRNNPGTPDDLSKKALNKAAQLRDLRSDFETLITGVIY